MKRIFIIILMAMLLSTTACSNQTQTTEENNATENNDQTETVDTGSEETSEMISEETVITFKDINLEAIIRENINKPDGDITVADVEGIYQLSIDNEETPVYELDGIEYLSGLEYFSYSYGNLKTLDPLLSNPMTTRIVFSYSQLENQPAVNVSHLEDIMFIDTNVSNFDFLKESEDMYYVYISKSGLESIDFLNNMGQLENVYLENNNINDISSLKDKTELMEISLHMNQVDDISVLETCSSLELLNISYNHVNNIEFLFDLEYLYQLTAYEELDKRIIPTEQFERLESQGVTVDYHH